MKIDDLRQCSLKELDALYEKEFPVALPSGQFKGTHLARLDTPPTRRPLYQVSLPFQYVPFGIDFDRCLWTFYDPLISIGRFQLKVQESRWRNSTVVALHYEISRLPNFIRKVLYDEVKPLSADLCLGIGGINRDKGVGDHFYFVLRRYS